MDHQTELDRHYVGILDGSGSVWGIRIPDLPGCYGGGTSANAAVADAISAMTEYADHYAKRGQMLPEPRSVGEILEGGEVDLAAGEGTVFLPLLLDSGRTVRANITLDAGLLETIDAEAKLRGLTRSAFLASAAREKIAARR
jgi:predicted RNase H-like HicB family nuclease